MTFDNCRREIMVLDTLMAIPVVALVLPVQRCFLHGVLARIVKGRVTA